jgi:hypothetical protein
MAPTTSVEERAALRRWIVSIDLRPLMEAAVPAAHGSDGVASAMSSLMGPPNVARAMSSLTGPSNVAAAAAVAETGDAGPPNAAKKNAIMQRVCG